MIQLLQDRVMNSFPFFFFNTMGQKTLCLLVVIANSLCERASCHMGKTPVGLCFYLKEKAHNGCVMTKAVVLSNNYGPVSQLLWKKARV